MEARSLTIINKKKKSPFFVWKPRPTFRSIYEEQKYFAEEKTKWVEGVGEVPGSLYFYLQECFIKHRIVPKGHESVERPAIRYASLVIHQAVQKAKKEQRVLGIIKGRGVGLSTEGGGLCNYYAKVHPGSNSIVTSKDMDGIAVLFREKIYIPYQHMDSKIRPDELRKSDTKAHCHLRLGVHHVGGDGQEKYSTSTIELRESSTKPSSPQNFSGQGAAFGFFDEFLLHPKKKELLNSSIECFRDPFTKELDGQLIFGGTAESSMDNAELMEFQKIVLDKDVWSCDILFLPFHVSMFLDEAGFPDEAKAYEWWNREYDKLQKDPSKARAFIRNNPRTLEDIFESVKGGRWEDETLDKIVIQKKIILNENIPLTTCNLVDMGGAINVDVVSNGSFIILEHPKPNVEYIQLVDGIKTGTETGDIDGSKMAGVIVKRYDPESPPFMPVCIYAERPRTVEMGHMKLVNQILYYNKFNRFTTISAEANDTADSFVTYLKKYDLVKYCLKRVDLSGKGYVNTNKIFNFRGAETIRFQYDLANIFLRKYIASIRMLPLIDDMLTGKDDNADILDAWLQLFIAFPNFDEPPPQPKKITARTTTILVIENGKTVYKTIPL